MAERCTRGSVHGSAIAIFIALTAALLAGKYTGGQRGVADLELLPGMALLGGAMFRDLAIMATAFGIDIEQVKRAGPAAVLALFLGLSVSFAVGATVGDLSGFRDPISLTTIRAGAATCMVGPVTGSSLGASSPVMALSIATGLVKAILTMAVTPVGAHDWARPPASGDDFRWLIRYHQRRSGWLSGYESQVGSLPSDHCPVLYGSRLPFGPVAFLFGGAVLVRMIELWYVA